MVGSSVANSKFSAKTVSPVRRLKSVDFPGVGVADQRNHRPRRALAPVAMERAGALDLLELAPDACHPVADHAAVGLDLGFAGTPEEAEAAALAFEVGPATDQPPGLIVEMGELDLQAVLPRSPRARRRFRG